MRKLIIIVLVAIFFVLFAASGVSAQRAATPTLEVTEATEATASSTFIENPTATAVPKADLTQEREETVEPLKKILESQVIGSVWPFNPIKAAIRSAVNAGVPPNTVVLLLLLPGVAALVAAARHLVGLRGFGIFLPAALAVTFVATGPLVGIGLFLVIVFVSTTFRMVQRRLKVKLQYLPRMALLLHFVVLGILLVLFSAPLITRSGLGSVSIFPVLILVLLAEDFSRVQLGKSVKVAVNLTTETLVLALLSYFFLTRVSVQETALLHPEAWILAIIIFDVLLGKYVGLRFLEYWRFRKLVSR